LESLPEWAEKFYELYSAPYLPTSETARSRVDQGLSRVLKHLPKKGSLVLDLCCGAGLYLFALERKGYEMTGVDIQQRMVDAARKYAKKTGSRAKIVRGNAMKLKFKDGAFDAIVFLGSATSHFSIQDLRKIADEAWRVLKPRGVVITEVNDHVALFLSGMYQRALYEPSGDKDVFSLHTRYDGERGTFNRLFVDLDRNQRFKGAFQIWAPWIFNYVMDEAGFELEGSESGAFGVFSKIYIHKKRREPRKE
jgi:ubiquinone/menaquinone biosynthesis C-methylase UbiE